jgi:hypothetical protein
MHRYLHPLQSRCVYLTIRTGDAVCLGGQVTRRPFPAGRLTIRGNELCLTKPTAPGLLVIGDSHHRPGDLWLSRALGCFRFVQKFGHRAPPFLNRAIIRPGAKASLSGSRSRVRRAPAWVSVSRFSWPTTVKRGVWTPLPQAVSARLRKQTPRVSNQMPRANQVRCKGIGPDSLSLYGNVRIAETPVVWRRLQKSLEPPPGGLANHQG